MAVVPTALLPRLLGAITWDIHEHGSKRDLLDRLPARLRGYRAWLPADWRILVVVDRDEQNCHDLKHQLEAVASRAGFVTRSTRRTPDFQIVNRLAIEELEAWYFGDWQAVRTAYPRVPATIPSQAGYREPDAIAGGTWEAFEHVLQAAGYFRTGGLRKIEAARAVAQHMPARNTSPSFRALRQALVEMGAP